MSAEDYIPFLFLIGGVGILGGLVFLVYCFYLAHKWVRSVDMIMLGHDVHAANIFFSVHAIIMYGSVFIWDWHAKRQKSIFDDRDWYVIRENVPLPVRKKFIFAFFLMLTSAFLMFVPAGILELLGALRVNHS